MFAYDPDEEVYHSCRNCEDFPDLPISDLDTKVSLPEGATECSKCRRLSKSGKCETGMREKQR